MKKSMTVILVIAIWTACSDRQKSDDMTDASSTSGLQASAGKHLFMDVHNLEPGKVTFDAVAGAHQKDLATQGKYDVSFIKYWVDEAQGKVYCLAEARDSASVYNAHKEAHGLVPDQVHQVLQGE